VFFIEQFCDNCVSSAVCDDVSHSSDLVHMRLSWKHLDSILPGWRQ